MGLTLGTVAGVRIRLHWSFVFLIPLAAYYWGPALGHGLTGALFGIMVTLAAFALVIIHELAHSWTARRLGISVAEIELSPLGGIAKMDLTAPQPKQEFLVALAGPLASLVSALPFAILVSLLVRQDRLQSLAQALYLLGTPSWEGLLLNLLGFSVLLVLFNLLPAFPMDGGRILRGLLSPRMGRDEATLWAAYAGQLIATAMAAVALLYSNLAAAVMAALVFLSSRQERQLVELRATLGPLRAQDVVSTCAQTLQANEPLSLAVDRLRHGQAPPYPVVEQGVYVGLLSLIDVTSALETYDASIPVRDIARTDLPLLAPEDDLATAHQRMLLSGSHCLAVVTKGTFVGTITLEQLKAIHVLETASRRRQQTDRLLQRNTAGETMKPTNAFDLSAFEGLGHGSRSQVEEITRAALAPADPRAAIQRALRMEGQTLWVCGRTYPLSQYERVFVVGAGKASAAMAAAVEQVLGERIVGGWVNVKDGNVVPTRFVTIQEAGHPLPDERSVEGSKHIVSLVEQATDRDLVLCLISGGGSALMTLPVEGIALSDMSELTRALLRCGATINEMNAVRKHIEQLKGGQLARLASPAAVISLILSDVIGSPLDVIASGPTSPDESTFADALSVLNKYELVSAAPRSVVRHLELGAIGRIPETPKHGDAALDRVQNCVIASNEQAAEAAVGKAKELGFHSLLLSTFIEGEAREVARVLAGILREIDHSGRPVPRPACVVAGGETTVTIRGNGLGGRNQELALAAVAPLAGLTNVALLSLGTDGSDGPTDAAGALTTGLTAARAAREGLNPDAFLANNDAYHFFESVGDLIKTGPTNTNVNDLVLLFAW